MVDYPSDEGVPPRVLAAEARRRRRELLEASSFFCQRCKHNKGEHEILGVSHIKHGRCKHPGCDCPSGDEKKYDPQGDVNLLNAFYNYKESKD